MNAVCKDQPAVSPTLTPVLQSPVCSYSHHPPYFTDVRAEVREGTAVAIEMLLLSSHGEGQSGFSLGTPAGKAGTHSHLCTQMHMQYARSRQTYAHVSMQLHIFAHMRKTYTCAHKYACVHARACMHMYAHAHTHFHSMASRAHGPGHGRH